MSALPETALIASSNGQCGDLAGDGGIIVAPRWELKFEATAYIRDARERDEIASRAR